MKKHAMGLVLMMGLAAYGQAQVFINEVCPANADVSYDRRYYNFTGWVELYNAGSSAVNIGNYYISDKATEPRRYRIPTGQSIPARGFVLIWCDEMNDGLHTNFSLDADGEDVVLSNASGALVDKITFPRQYLNVSYGRLGNGAGAMGYFETPTPGNTNGTVAATQQLTTPVVSRRGGRYTGQQQITVTHPDAAATLRYTTDGAEPVAASPQYNSGITITATRTLKVKAFRTGYIPSETETNTYFINEHAFSLPVVSLSTKPAYLWDNTFGIYTDGTNGRVDYCQAEPKNWAQDWDRHAVFEYFDAGGVRRFRQHVDIRIGGNCSRAFPQKAFVLKARDKYGSKTMDYRFFASKEVDEFGGLMYRNSGNDFNYTLFRDALMQTLPIGQMDVDYLAYQPTAFYLNGEYWGIQNIREKIDADYFESNYGITREDLDLLEAEWALEGTADAWFAYKNTLSGMDRTTPEAFDFIDQHIDVQEFINYLVAEIYYANTDWPGNNVKFWRQRSTNGKFRWVLWDLDFGMGLYDWSSWPTHPTLEFVTDTNGPDWPNPPWSTEHIRMVLENPTFRARFIQTFTAAMNTTFHPQRVNRFADEFAKRLEKEIPFHAERWDYTVDLWNYEISRLKDFSTERNMFMRNHLAQFFGLGESAYMSVQINGEGSFRLNDILADGPMTDAAYFKGLPYKLEAVPAPGHLFKEWKIRERASVTVPMIDAGSTWKYNDGGASPAADWATAAYDDSAWASGAAQLGYGDGDETTVVGFGPHDANKFITTYFRKNFTLADTVGLGQPSARVLFDDGVAIYINGVEVYRNNLPAGALTSSTLALEAVASENVFVPFTIPKGILKPGDNIVAVEMHQSSPTSSDLSFDFALQGAKLGSVASRTSTVTTEEGIVNSDMLVEVTFEPDPRAISGLYINEISPAPSAFTDNAGDDDDWIELYNAGSQPVDLAGLFITDNPAQKKKHKMAPDAGVMQPGDFKILWADEETAEGPDHLNIKLSAEGESVQLYQSLNDAMLKLDEVTFGAQQGTGSFSRIPDATGAWAFTARITPGETNELVLSVPENIAGAVFPNPVRSTLYIRAARKLSRAELVDARGRIIRTFEQVGAEGLDVATVPPGFYLLRLYNGSGSGTVKIVKE